MATTGCLKEISLLFCIELATIFFIDLEKVVNLTSPVPHTIDMVSDLKQVCARTVNSCL